ncbi:ABC transporter permease [Paracoccus limosus]|uniref:ABC transporter permease n=1 Tax=Paracoccus limosus TaxID=913252 RepID=UPI001B8646B4|nr:hypothetical protein [Paracoccus limosus]
MSDQSIPKGRTREAGRGAPHRLAGLAYGLSGLLVLLALWWAATDLMVAKTSFAHRFSPTAALPALWTLMLSGALWPHVVVSLKRVLIGLAVALAVGVPLGLLVGASRRAEAATTPAFQFLRMISPLSWMPIAVMVFGVGDAPIICKRDADPLLPLVI